MGTLRQARITELPRQRQRCGIYGGGFLIIAFVCLGAIIWTGYASDWQHLSEEQLFSLLREWWVMGAAGLGTLSVIIALCCALRCLAIDRELRRRIPDWDA